MTAVADVARGSSKGEYRDAIREFITWTDLNHLRLNIFKTKGSLILEGLNLILSPFMVELRLHY